jgi:hypothetical protein
MQSGHKEALMNPGVVLEDDTSGKIVRYSPKQTPMQEYIWAVYEKNVKELVEIADRDEIIIVTGGDLCQGTYFSHYLISTRLSDQVAIACANLDYLLDRCKKVKAIRMVKGTGYHEFGEGSAAILIAAHVRDRYGINVEVYNMGLFNVNGKTFDVAHKRANEGKRKWLGGNEARFYTRDIMFRSFEFGKRPPDYILGYHYHQYLKVTANEFWGGVDYETTFILTPSFQGKDEYIIDRLRSFPILHNGMVIFEIEEQKPCVIHPLIEILDLRIQETL